MLNLTPPTPPNACPAHAGCWVTQHPCVMAVESPSIDAKRNIARLIRSSPWAGLCYDTQRVEAMPFSVALPDKTPWALS
jgi:hypothetical protein